MPLTQWSGCALVSSSQSEHTKPDVYQEQTSHGRESKTSEMQSNATDLNVFCVCVCVVLHGGRETLKLATELRFYCEIVRFSLAAAKATKTIKAAEGKAECKK